MRLNSMSNMMLALGVVMLVIFGLLQVTGDAVDPLVPAAAALLIGSAAVLDRVGTRTVH